eukprot:14535451-Alexandrium_andersonii.AAC.1
MTSDHGVVSKMDGRGRCRVCCPRGQWLEDVAAPGGAVRVCMSDSHAAEMERATFCSVVCSRDGLHG